MVDSSFYGFLFGLMALVHGLISLLTHSWWFWEDFVAYVRKFLWRSYITFHVEEYSDDANANELFSAVQLHLSHSASFENARNVNVALPKGASALSLSLAAHERILDTFQGCTIWWELKATERKHQPEFNLSASADDRRPDEKRSLRLVLHKKDKRQILPAYLNHILAHAKDLKLQSKERLLYTNMKSHTYLDWGGRRKVWASVPFEHPATFETLALDPHLKKKIIEDLTSFAHGEAFYKRAGRAWKRGYLLHGPPGTGKSSMIAAMANFLHYDVYDLELTEVKSNAHLRNLLIKTTNKSIIVIEDIDCSLHLTDTINRVQLMKDQMESSILDDRDLYNEEGQSKSHVTLSGLLNFTDGLWSCCGSERIFVFTTNHIDKLDPALLRSGRMDMHIHLSYCTFEAFKVLAANYLCLDKHELFEDVHMALAKEGVKITPAEVAEVLTRERMDARKALECLLHELQRKRKVSTSIEYEEDGSITFMREETWISN